MNGSSPMMIISKKWWKKKKEIIITTTITINCDSGLFTFKLCFLFCFVLFSLYNYHLLIWWHNIDDDTVRVMMNRKTKTTTTKINHQTWCGYCVLFLISCLTLKIIIITKQDYHVKKLNWRKIQNLIHMDTIRQF